MWLAQIGTCGTKEQYTNPSEDIEEDRQVRPGGGYQKSAFGGQPVQTCPNYSKLDMN